MVTADTATTPRDGAGAVHKRRIELGKTALRVEDELGGAFGRAVLRWRLAPGAWQLSVQDDGARLVDANGRTLTLRATMPVARCALVEGWESLHYLEKTTVPVLEVEVREAGSVITEIGWAV